MVLVIKRPAECSNTEIDTFIDLVREGGEVATAGLRNRVLSAEKLIFLNQGNLCQAIAALKHPQDSYKAKVFDAASVTSLQSCYELEIGYIFSLKKGLGNEIMNGISQAVGSKKAFATTRENNSVMQHLLPKYGFTKIGKPYKSESGNYYLGLFGNET